MLWHMTCPRVSAYDISSLALARLRDLYRVILNMCGVVGAGVCINCRLSLLPRSGYSGCTARSARDITDFTCVSFVDLVVGGW